MKRTLFIEQKLDLVEEIEECYSQIHGKYEKIKYFCPKCNLELTELVDGIFDLELNYCPKCGYKINESVCLQK